MRGRRLVCFGSVGTSIGSAGCARHNSPRAGRRLKPMATWGFLLRWANTEANTAAGGARPPAPDSNRGGFHPTGRVAGTGQFQCS